MFTSKPHDDPDSDSDWDSLSGDAGPPSSHEPSPRVLQPVPPSADSPRIQIPNSKNTSTPLRKPVKTPSKPRSPNTESERGGTTFSNQKPNQLYGKNSGVTTFVDRSNHSIRTLNGDDNHRMEHPVDSNSNSVIYSTVNKRKDKPNSQALELNELEINSKETGQANLAFSPGHEEPPYMDFKGALPANDVREPTKPEQKKGRIKSAYIRNKTPDQLESPSPRAPDAQSWEDSDKEDSLQKLSIDKLPQNCESKDLVDGKGHVIDMHMGGDEGCFVPYQKSQGTGYTYIFHHGKYQYLKVVPEWREPYMKSLAQRAERWLTYFWEEFFGAIGLIVDFGLIFLLEFLKFTFRKVLVRIVVGFIVVFGDHLLKPVLTAAFNSLLQPSFTFSWNVLVGLRNAIQPFLNITSQIVHQIVTLVKGFRLFELNWKPSYPNAIDTHNSQALTSRHQVQEI